MDGVYALENDHTFFGLYNFISGINIFSKAVEKEKVKTIIECAERKKKEKVTIHYFEGAYSHFLCPKFLLILP